MYCIILCTGFCVLGFIVCVGVFSPATTHANHPVNLQSPSVLKFYNATEAESSKLFTHVNKHNTHASVSLAGLYESTILRSVTVISLWASIHNLFATALDISHGRQTSRSLCRSWLQLQGSIDWMYYSRVYLEIGIPLIVDQSVTGDQLTGGSVCSWGTRPEGNAVFTSFIFWSSSLSFVCTVWVYFFVRSRLWTCFSSCYHLLVFNCFMTFILLCTEFWHLYDMCSGNLLDVHCVDNIPVQVYRNHTCTVMDI